MSIPAPRIPVGEATDADRLRACDRLSAVHGREIRGGWSVEQLAAEYALLYAAGFEAGQRADPGRLRVPEYTADDSDLLVDNEASR